MPHFIVEHSTNLDDAVDFPAFCDEIRDVAVETGVFPLGGIRVRVHPCETYAVADGNPENAFVHIELRMGAGRDMETRKQAGETVFEAMTAFLEPLFDARPFALSFEINEIDSALSFKKNSIHRRLAASASSQPEE